jgi:hypothetical protein
MKRDGADVGACRFAPTERFLISAFAQEFLKIHEVVCLQTTDSRATPIGLSVAFLRRGCWI